MLEHRNPHLDHEARRFVSAVCHSPAMAIDEREAMWLFHFQRGVLSAKQAQDCGFTPDAIRHRSRAGGRWQRLLPGVYLTSTGQPTREQLLTAAQLYAGPSSLISGLAALRAYELSVPASRRVDVLVPRARQRTGCAFPASPAGDRTSVAIHRATRLPEPEMRDLAIAYAPVARAVADTVRGLSTRQQVRAVVASAVQKRACTIRELAAELADGPRRGSGLFRSVLAEVADGSARRPRRSSVTSSGTRACRCRCSTPSSA